MILMVPFCSLKIVVLQYEFPQKIIPCVIMEWKYE